MNNYLMELVRISRWSI